MAWSTKVIPNDGWNAGARTIASLMADGLVEFEVGQAVGIVCGLNDVDNDADYLEIDHGFLIESGKATVIEGGIKKGGYVSYTTGATFSISRINGVVLYYIDGSLLYTSLTPSIGTVFVDCSLYAANDSILGMRFTNHLSGSIQLSPLSAFGIDLVGDYGLVSLSHLIIANDDIPDPIQLSPLAVSGSDGNFGEIKLSPLTIQNDRLIPDSNYGYLTLSPLIIREAADVVAEGTISFLPIACFGMDANVVDVGISSIKLEPLIVLGIDIDGVIGSGEVELQALTLFGIDTDTDFVGIIELQPLSALGLDIDGVIGSGEIELQGYY